MRIPTCVGCPNGVLEGPIVRVFVQTLRECLSYDGTEDGFREIEYDRRSLNPFSEEIFTFL